MNPAPDDGQFEYAFEAAEGMISARISTLEKNMADNRTYEADQLTRFGAAASTMQHWASRLSANEAVMNELLIIRRNLRDMRP